MKRLSLILPLLCLCLLLTACDPASYSFDEAELANGLVSVELINYDNPNQKSFASWVPDHSSDIRPFDHQKMTVSETLPEEKHGELVKRLSEADILSGYYTFDSPRGVCVKLTYENGEFLIISTMQEQKSYVSFICKYASDGTMKDYVGSFSDRESYDTLIGCFIEDDTEHERGNETVNVPSELSTVVLLLSS